MRTGILSSGPMARVILCPDGETDGDTGAAAAFVDLGGRGLREILVECGGRTG